MGPDRLGLVHGTSRDEAREFIERFFAKFSTIRSFQEELIERARKEGYALTKCGRRRTLLALNSSHPHPARLAEGAAVNPPI